MNKISLISFKIFLLLIIIGSSAFANDKNLYAANTERNNWEDTFAAEVERDDWDESLFAVKSRAKRNKPKTAEGPRVNLIEIEYKGLQNVSEQVILSHINIRRGRPLSQNAIEDSIQKLNDTNLFESIDVKTEINGDDVELKFIVEPRYRISSISFNGNDKMSDRRLFTKIDSKKNNFLDEKLIKKDRDAIYEYYLKNRFSDSEIYYDIERDSKTGFGTVVFNISEGPKLRIVKIKFNGNKIISSKKLRKVLKTKQQNTFSWFTGAGKFNEDKFREDIRKLREHYTEKGFLDINISEPNIKLDYPTENTILINIKISEGKKYHVGNVNFEGNLRHSYQDIFAKLSLKPGETFVPSKLGKDITAISDLYGREGYLDTRVTVDRRPNVTSGDMDLSYQIVENGKFQVESIRIEGNTKTKSTVIIRELALAPGDIFDSVRMRNSEARLRNTRFFDQVNLSSEVTNVPTRRNLKLSVSEARTGNFTFGAGFSSLENGLFFAELTQGNFDLFNWRSFFQGDGQKFRLRFQLGSRSNEIVLAFEEPWLFEKELAFGFEIFRRETDFVSSLYDELRAGFELYLRKRIVGLWEGRLSYRFENVDIVDVDASAPDVINNEEGKRSVSKVGFSLLRDTRDSILYPTRGNRISILNELAGLGGDTKYYRFETRASQHYPTFKFAGQVISFLGRIGTIIGYDNSEVPFFDKQFLGGPNSLRGFDFREVGPKDPTTEEPIGGNSYGFASVEYTFKIAEPLRIAFFYDWGFVNKDEIDFDTSDYNSNWGIGFRILVLGSPMRLDFGIPITTDSFNDNDGNEFNFSFGTRF